MSAATGSRDSVAPLRLLANDAVTTVNGRIKKALTCEQLLHSKRDKARTAICAHFDSFIMQIRDEQSKQLQSVDVSYEKHLRELNELLRKENEDRMELTDIADRVNNTAGGNEQQSVLVDRLYSVAHKVRSRTIDEERITEIFNYLEFLPNSRFQQMQQLLAEGRLGYLKTGIFSAADLCVQQSPVQLLPNRQGEHQMALLIKPLILGNVAFCLGNLIVDIKNDIGENVQFRMQTMEDGIYQQMNSGIDVVFAATRPGIYRANILLYGEHISGSPYQFSVEGVAPPMPSLSNISMQHTAVMPSPIVNGISSAYVSGYGVTNGGEPSLPFLQSRAPNSFYSLPTSSLPTYELAGVVTTDVGVGGLSEELSNINLSSTGGLQSSVNVNSSFSAGASQEPGRQHTIDFFGTKFRGRDSRGDGAQLPSFYGSTTNRETSASTTTVIRSTGGTSPASSEATLTERSNKVPVACQEPFNDWDDSEPPVAANSASFTLNEVPSAAPLSMNAATLNVEIPERGDRGISLPVSGVQNSVFGAEKFPTSEGQKGPSSYASNARPNLRPFINRRGEIVAEHLLTFGQPGRNTPENEMFQLPIGCSYNEESHHYVICDTGHNCVKIYDRSGDPLIMILSQFEGGFKRPSAVVCAPDLKAYVIKDDNAISVFDYEGSPLLDMGRRDLKKPFGLARDNRGKIFVIDEESPRNRFLYEFDVRMPDTFIKHDYAGAAGTQHPVSVRFMDIDCAREQMVVSDYRAHCAYVTDLEGKPLGSFGGQGAAEGKMRGPSGISIDSGGNIVMGDSQNSRVQVYDHGGVYLGRIMFPVPIKCPSDLHLTSTGQLMIMNYSRHFVTVFQLKPPSV